MKISMWIIAKHLEKYHPKCNIRDGSASITGVRLLPDSGEDALLPQYVYLGLNKDEAYPYDPPGSAILFCGADSIILQAAGDISDILNELLSIFDFYNAWEISLWEASALKSFQKIIDLGDTVLENPMMVGDMSGNVLAMSSAYREKDINEYWIESRVTGLVPALVLGAPMQKQDGEVSSWTETPEIYLMPDKTKTIGVYLTAGGAAIAGLGLWEHKRPILPSDLYLVKVLCGVLTSTMEAQKQSTSTRSRAAILADLLDGVQIEPELLGKLDIQCERPWRLVVLDNPFHSDVTYQNNLLQRLQTSEIAAVSLLHDDHVIALTSQDCAAVLLYSVIGTKEKQYYLAGISLPFDDLSNLRTRYAQTLYTIGQADSTPGIYHGEDYALPYLLLMFAEQNRTQALTHPALDQLKRYDREKNSALYETLYQYLINERSVLLSAQALHIHKNTLLYRLERLQTVIDVDLDDPMQRNYLLLSFLLERSGDSSRTPLFF